MPKKVKRVFETEDCQTCGDLLMVETEARPGRYCDGDLVKCSWCDQQGSLSLDPENGNPKVIWLEEE